MPTPSLLIVPARFKSGKLYSQIPTSGAGDFTVTRATTATRVNASGLIESVASGIPRLDYFASDGTVGCPALLVEPAAQNLAFHSSNWTSNWVNTAITVVTGTTATTDPFGTNLANAISPTSGNTVHIAQSNNPTQITYTSGTIYTQSAFFKQGTGVAGRYVQLTFPGPIFSQLGYANFDLQLGTLAVVSGTSADTNRAASIENFGNGWYRCRLTATCTLSATAVGFTSALATASGALRVASFSGTVTDVIYGWGAQLETGSVATSYIPTTTAAVTRNADVVLVSGAVSGSIGQTEGTLYAEFSVDFNNRDADILSLDGGSTSDGFFMSIRSSSVVQLIVRTASANALIFQRTGAFSAGVNKLAVAYKNGDFAICLNGTTVQTNTSSITMPSVSINRAGLGQNRLYNLNQQLRILDAALYTTRLSNSELAALTSL
jgi:hypothetical protein